MKRCDGFAGTEGSADVSVVVVTYNSSDDIGDLLDDLRCESVHLAMRVVVVDNDSSDHTMDIVALQPDVIAIAVGGNLGYAGGINVARRHVGDCDAVVVLNPDLRLRPGALSTMLRALDHSRVGVVVPRIVDGTGSTYPSLRSEPSVVGALGDSLFGRRMSWRSGRLSETVWNAVSYEYPHQVDWATGAALLIRADIDRLVGDWSEEFFLYSEEVDYMRRVRECGALVWFEPAAVVEHRGSGSGTSRDLETLMAVNRIRYFGKYHSDKHSRSYGALVAAEALLRSYDHGHRATFRMLCDRRRWDRLPRAQLHPPVTTAVAIGSIIIPAHDESAVIWRTLEPLAAAAEAGVVEIIVVCNGCTDNTSDIARSIPGVIVTEIAEASKVAALNLGDATAALWPRLYLDADTRITLSAAEEVFTELRSGSTLAARPASTFDVEEADALVRSYYRARSRIAWFRTALWGAGAYGLSEDGHRRIGSFPALTGDDLWVDTQFESSEKTVVDTDPTTVVVPRDWHSLLLMLRRVYRGKAEVTAAPRAVRTCAALMGGVRGPQSAWDAGVYITLTLIARRRAKQVRILSWERDESSRVPATAAGAAR